MTACPCSGGCTGVKAEDFDCIMGNMKRTVSFQAVTRSQDAMTGEETTVFAAASDVEMIFFLEANRFIWDKEGLVEVGDAYVMAPTSVGIKRYDQITVDSQKYYVENVTRKHVLDVAMHDFCILFKVE